MPVLARRPRRTAVAGRHGRQHHPLRRLDRRRRWRAHAARGSGAASRAIGLDAEPIAPLPAGVLDVVASAGEREAVARLGGERPGIPWDTLLFSAKEATYKAWYPLTGAVVGHDAVRVELSPAGAFTAVATADDASGREVVPGCAGAGCSGRGCSSCSASVG